MTSEERHEARYQRRKAKREKKKAEIADRKFEDVMSFDHLYKSGKKCCNGCRWKTSTINYESKLFWEIFKLHRNLVHQTYRSKSFRSFITIEHGKERNIDAMDIRDRTVQKCLCTYILTEAYGRSFILDNTASQKYKGIHFALDRFKKHLRDHYKKYGLEGGVLLFDFKNFFGSIPHESAKARLLSKINDPKLQKLVCHMIDDFQKLSINKNLEIKTNGVGLGSEVSQVIAIDYPSPIDHYIKDVMQIKGYGRYNDDGYVICESFDKLEEIRATMFKMAEDLGIQLSEKKTVIVPLKNRSFTFLKIRTRITESGNIIQKITRRSVKDMNRKLKKFRQFVDRGKMTIENVFQAYQSWRAHAIKFNSYKTVKSMDEKFVSMFKEELMYRKKKYKCYLHPKKTRWGWIYLKIDDEYEKEAA